MAFNYFESERKHLYTYYDSLLLIGVHEYNGQLFLLYSIGWAEDLSTLTYMLVAVTEADIEQFKQGAKSFLQQKLNEQKLYHYSFSYEEGNELNEIRLLTAAEADDVFPTNDFITTYEYDETHSWVF